MLITATVIMFALLQSGQSWPWISYTSLAFLTVSILLVYITMRIERRAEEPILPIWVWKKRELMGSNLATMGMGVIMIGPGMYLPVFAQSVTGVSAIAAGFILASMSFTWPLSSSLSGKLYLRIGFRNTALCGIVFVILGASSFLLMRFPGAVWVLVAMQLMMGAGFGLIATPLLIGVQSTVAWGQRGVVTGANMFSRYFGQSIGSAIFAAIFNAVLSDKLENAPVAFQSDLPHVNQVMEVLQSQIASPEVSLYLREAFFAATQNVYIGLMAVGLVTLGVLLLTPSQFKPIE